MTLVINLVGSPGTGKSTVAADLFAKLKWNNINCELVTEYVKGQVFEGRNSIFHDQIYIFAKQLHAIKRVIDKVDVIVTDSPIILSLYYGKNLSDSFKKLVLEEHHSVNSLNILLKRTKPYHKVGRNQTEEESNSIAVELKEILERNAIDYIEMDANKETAEIICNMVKGRMLIT